MSNILNNSGLEPLGCRVLIKPVIPENKTSGGILLPDSAVDAEKARQQDAYIVAMGKDAFMREINGRLEPYPDKPMVGAKVRIIKYMGDSLTGTDGEEYRLLNDVDILAIIKE